MSGPTAMAAPAMITAESRKTMAESASSAISLTQKPPYCVPVGSDIVVLPPSPSLVLRSPMESRHYSTLRDRFNDFADALEQPIDLRFFDNEGR